jgi:hypothetical protein
MSLKQDILKTTTVQIVTALFYAYVIKIKTVDNFFDIEKMTSLGIKLIALVVYNYFIHNTTKNLNSEGNNKDAMKAILKHGTVLLSSLLVKNYLFQKELSMKQLIPILMTVGAYVVFYLFIQNKLPNLTKNKNQKAVIDTTAMITANVIPDFVNDFDVEVENLPKLVALMMSVPVYHLIVKPMF